MARLTIKSVNAAIAAKGIKAEIVKGNGYYWFDGAVNALNHLTLEQWMEELATIVADHKSRL